MAPRGPPEPEDGVTAAIASVEVVPDPAALEAIVREYLETVWPHFRPRLGDALDPAAMAAATLGNLPAYLPPRGRLLLAHGEDGALLGTCFLRMVRPDSAELKRLFVRPAARGMGLGRALARRAIHEAREMGAARILLDTGAWMTEALALYRAMGFRETARYPESENPAEVADLLVYLELVLPPPPLSSA
jgi:ribosomal protein S18 acetylase RimI-like enzyme